MNVKRVLSGVAASIVALSPVLVGAQTGKTGATVAPIAGGNIIELWTWAIGIINNLLVPSLIAIAIVVVLWGVVQMLINADDDGAREKGRTKILYGIIGIAVMVSIWGLVAFVRSSAGFGNDEGIAPPQAFPTVKVN